jgi:hypothetical protein
MPLLTLFTAPKPFVNPHISIIQRNAIRSWLALGSDVEVLLLGNDKGVAETAEELRVKYIPEVKTNSLGTPLISSLFDTARALNDTPLLAYVNTDIILFNDFLASARLVSQTVQKFLLIGQRWDLDVPRELDFSDGWQEHLKEECRKTGMLHKPMGSDYFTYPRACFQHIPDFAVGRAGWDNWMIYESRRCGWKTIDATQDIMIIHQSHDYSHLPNGQPHYKLPETSDNVRMAGGKRAIFLLRDANYHLSSGMVTKKKANWQRICREMEIFPLVKIHSRFLGEVFFAVFHPYKAYGEFRASLRSRKAQNK